MRKKKKKPCHLQPASHVIIVVAGKSQKKPQYFLDHAYASSLKDGCPGPGMVVLSRCDRNNLLSD